MNKDNDLKVAEMAKNFAQELGRELLRNNRARARVRRFLREKHLEKVIQGGNNESRNNDKCDDLDVDLCKRLQREV